MLRPMNITPATSASPDRPHLAGAWRDAAAARDLRLLLVDDCLTNRLLVAAVLARWGIVPSMACDGEQAPRMTRQHAYDIVLMDMLMPVMDGVVATTKIRQDERQYPRRGHTPIIAYTTLDLGSDPMRLARIGLNATLPKPCSASSLQACLAQWCPDKFWGL